MSRFSPVFLVAAFVIALTYSSAPAFAQYLPQSMPADATGITDPAEYQAYLEALNTDNPFTIDKFVRRYPQSGGLEKVLQHGIARYVDSSDWVLNYWASGEDKVLEFAKRLRESAPGDMRPLAAITALDAKRVSIGKNELVPEMCSDAQAGLKQLPDWTSPEGMTPSKSNKLRKKVAYTFHLVAGECAFQNKDFVGARALLARAVQLYPTRLPAVYALALSDLQKPIDAQGFAYCDKTIQILKQRGPNGRRSADYVANYCRAVYRSMDQEVAHGRNETVGQSASEKTLSPFSVALNGNNAAEPR